MRWFRNSAGKPDAMLTFATLGFAVTSLCVILSMVESVSVGSLDLTVKTPSESLLLGYLAATFTSYVVRRNKKDELATEEAKLALGNGSQGE